MKTEFEHIGFTIIESVYSLEELHEILKFLGDNEISGQFGVREFLYKNPEIKSKKDAQRIGNNIQNEQNILYPIYTS